MHTFNNECPSSRYLSSLGIQSKHRLLSRLMRYNFETFKPIVASILRVWPQTMENINYFSCLTFIIFDLVSSVGYINTHCRLGLFYKYY